MSDTIHKVMLQNIPEKQIYQLCCIGRLNTPILGRLELLGFVAFRMKEVAVA
jgi:hypothetical protein